MKNLSIICSYRGREDRVEDFLFHYNSYYPNSDIILVRQIDQSAFKKGQLYNIGFLHAKEESMMFVDIDIRFQKHIDILNIMRINNVPFYPYLTIKQCRMVSLGKYNIMPGRVWNKTPGGVYVTTKEQYISFNGHSNLYVGYGYEDDEFKNRANPVRLEHELLHIYHPNRETPTTSKRMRLNGEIFNKRGIRDIQLDGYKQAKYTINNIESLSNNVRRINVKDIGVVDDFKYKEYLEKV